MAPPLELASLRLKLELLMLTVEVLKSSSIAPPLSAELFVKVLFAMVRLTKLTLLCRTWRAPPFFL
jgi:hypothetical protein